MPRIGQRWAGLLPELTQGHRLRAPPSRLATGPALPPSNRPRPAQSGWRRRRCARTGSDSAGRPCSPLGRQDQGSGHSAMQGKSSNFIGA